MVAINGCGGPVGPAVTGDCAANLRMMYAAYIETLTGQRIQQVQTADFRTVIYQAQHNLPALVASYNAMRPGCDGVEDLPMELSNPNVSSAKRGGPILAKF